ncbi:DUF5615 family PIN-like protein [Candidatus Woesearchaeota archaeon]|nr:DUF5615 family PIN-like protein [Candidatus Woesearchaeota archaeon]
MKLFLDENISLLLVFELQKLGFEVEHAISVGLRGAKDGEIAQYAKKQKAILVTKDIEFGSLLLYPKGTHYGLIILRFPCYFTTPLILKHLKIFLINGEEKDLMGKMAIVEIGKYRVRDIE